MNTVTVRMATDSVRADCAAVEFAVQSEGGAIAWAPRGRSGRQYGIVTDASPRARAALREIGSAEIRDGEIIALALYPSALEALPALAHALGGRGAPDGVLACDATPGGLILEWDPTRTAPSIVYGLIDIELARFRAGRVVEVLVPLSDGLLARIAAEGLRAPELTAERVLEWQLEHCDVVG